MSESLRVVFDTQIYLRAAINSTSICGKLFSDWTEAYILCVADEIEAEIIDVLTRSKIRAKFSQITDETVETIKSTLARAERFKLEDIPSVCRDPKDDIFLACAKAANALYLVSEDNDLLILKQYEETAIVNALEFLHILEQH
ncbi:MAG: putative toxin-antitoxin system toxin component, PIN family [Chloroflexi bacterium]|nr:putative toxin-antitoxin system toxin component, PIN family [Chloroflexota bacterium]